MRRHRIAALMAAAALAWAAPGTGAAGQLGVPEQLVRASGTVTEAGETYRLAFVVSGDVAALWVRRARDGAQQVFAVDNPPSALLILADRNLSFLWPALTDWAGPSLDKLRARSLARARADWITRRAGPPRSTTESMVAEPVRALLQYTRTLWLMGEQAEANALLRAALAANDRRSDDARADYSMVSVRLGNQLVEGGDPAAAAALYAEVEQALAGSSYAINATINRAYIAVERGQYADGLQLIDRAFAAFQGVSPPTRRSQGEPVPGSLREFAWIKACALNGLGRKAEAQAVLGPAMVREEPADPQFILTPNANIRFRALMCMHDAAGAADEVLRAIKAAPLAPAELVTLQPGFHRADWDEATLAAVKADPRVRAVLGDRMRVLPAELQPALRHWAPR